MAIAKKEMTQFAVIGMGRFGSALTKTLYEQGNDVLAIDLNPDVVNSIANYCTHAAVADGSDEQALKALGITNFDAVIICVGGNMQASIMATLACKELGVPFIVCKANNEKHKNVLQKVGADYVVVPEVDMARKVAVKITSPHLNDVMSLTQNFNIAETDISSVWNEHTLMELDFRRKYDVIVLLVKRGETVITSPNGDFKLMAGDSLVVGGSKDSIQKFIEKLANS